MFGEEKKIEEVRFGDSDKFNGCQHRHYRGKKIDTSVQVLGGGYNHGKVFKVKVGDSLPHLK